MAQEKSCGAILFTLRQNVPYYLIIETNSGHIGFPKGHVEPDETEAETARREILEETGVKVGEFVPGFRETCTYRVASGNEKEVVYFLAEYTPQPFAFQQEEIVRHWVEPFDQAVRLVNKKREQEILQLAHRLLQRSLSEK